MSAVKSSPLSQNTPGLPLVRMVRRFATAPETLAAERRDFPRSTRARLDRLLQEIDETILPRRLRVTCESAPHADLVISNRRLVSIYHDTGTQDVSKRAAQNQTDLATQLLELSKRARSVEKLANARAIPASEMDDSCSVDALRRRLGVDQPTDDISVLREYLDEHARARLWWDVDAKKLQFRGDTKWKTHLRQHAAHLHQQMDTQSAMDVARSGDMTGLAIPLAGNLILIAACDGRKGYICVSPRVAGLNAISAWQITSKSG